MDREPSHLAVHILAVLLGTMMILWGMSNTHVEPPRVPTPCSEPCQSVCRCPD